MGGGGGGRTQGLAGGIWADKRERGSGRRAEGGAAAGRGEKGFRVLRRPGFRTVKLFGVAFGK